MKKLILIVFLSFAPLKSHADFWGGDIPLLIEIVTNTLNTLMELRQQSQLMEDEMAGIKDRIKSFTAKWGGPFLTTQVERVLDEMVIRKQAEGFAVKRNYEFNEVDLLGVDGLGPDGLRTTLIDGVITDPNVFGIFFAGHGTEGIGEFADGGALTSSLLAARSHHKLGELYLYACSTSDADAARWAQYVSKYGSFRYSDKKVRPYWPFHHDPDTLLDEIPGE